ncbi:Enoyl-[acyl-carrier-protein] reductase [Heyndrickxia sporothermodurans]|uniref:Probable nitronate monooxygenase n=1 Tax=Heyndrickxia sporothermodurans TaxID=46224 RepID=A0A150L4U0_9BACI|nr:nitronate monooxygenase [Heyndrickxia sporothermodurans]KYD07059.1 Enoyl-[acyl-carrier-protein] reductase [Heyndrickxia sporothermodurans]
MFHNNWIETLHIDYPIIQAPMAGGITTPELVAAVSNAGGLGMIGAGYLNAEQTRKIIREVKSLTSNPFGINLFVPEKNAVDEVEILKMNTHLQKYREELNLPMEMPTISNNSVFEEQVRIIIEEGVPICTFTFGLPTEPIVKQLKEANIFLMGTATTVKEAQYGEKAGMDVIVAQGSEAGGHRGTFLEDTESSMIGLISLIPQVVDQVNIPVIAGGGIMDERGIMAARCLGAQGVQMGTAFLTCVESGAHELHKEAILKASEEEIVVTAAFSGKNARGINNRFIKEMSVYEGDIPSYPVQNSLTKDIRKAAGEQNNPNFMSLWSGQSPRLSKNKTVSELIQGLVDGYNRIKGTI